MTLATVLTVINIGLACYNVWKELRAKRPHPLEAALRDIAAAVRGQVGAA